MKRIIVIAFLFGIVHSGNAQERPFNERQQHWSEVMNKEGNKWRIHWNEYTDVPIALYNGVSKSYVGTPEKIARQFLLDNRNLFSMKENLSDLKYKYTKTNRGVHHVTFYQFKNGRIGMVNGS